MAHVKIQNYPRRDDYLAKDELCHRPKKPINAAELSEAITRAYNPA